MYSLCRGGSRNAARSKMEHFVIIVDGEEPLTIITKRSIFDLAAVLDPPLNMLSTFNIFEHNESSKKDIKGLILWQMKSKKSFIFFVKFTKDWNFPLFFPYCKVSCIILNTRNCLFYISLFVLKYLSFIWMQYLRYPCHWSMLFLLNKSHCMVATLATQFLFHSIS